MQRQAPRLKRKLAAILSADVKGYSSLTEADEEGTHRTLTAYRETMVALIARHDGRVAGTAGDSVLAEFMSSVEAVRCAAAVQEELAKRNAELPHDKRLEFRIGINLSDVISEDGDIFGDGVNVAARLQEIAAPGGICVSGAIRDQVGDRLGVAFEDQGEQSVKNLARPIRVFRVRLDEEAAPASPARGEGVRPPLGVVAYKPSIAVLPFVNMSGDPEQEFFADGLTEDIITALSRFRDLFVISRNSVFVHKGKAAKVQDVAREFGVQYLVEGSVRKLGNRVRITVQLIDAEIDRHVWGERYDRELANIFELQDEITATIVGAIKPALGKAERLRAKRKPPESLDAWDQYQRGLWHYWQRKKNDAEEADRLFQRATELDPSFSSAYAGISEVCYIKMHHGWTDKREETLRRGLDAAQQAVLLDDEDAFAHFALGRIHLEQGQLQIAIIELKKATDLNPNLAIAYYGLGKAFLWSGDAQEALRFVHQAIRLSPRDPLRFAFEEIVGAAHFQLAEYKEAAEWSRKASQHPTSSFWTHTHLATALIELNSLEEARAAIKQALCKQPDLSVTSVSSMLDKMDLKYRQRILACLSRAGLPE